MKKIEILSGVVVGGKAANAGDQFEVGRDLTAREARSLIRRGLAKEVTESKATRAQARREAGE